MESLALCHTDTPPHMSTDQRITLSPPEANGDEIFGCEPSSHMDSRVFVLNVAQNRIKLERIITHGKCSHTEPLADSLA